MINYASNIEDLETYFLSKGAMSRKKLQGLLYHAYAWYLVFYNESNSELQEFLFEAEFEAWVHGPMMKDYYFEHREHWNHTIVKALETPDLNPEITEHLDEIWDIYGEFNAHQLSAVSKQLPYKIARMKSDTKAYEISTQLVSNVDIFDYYLTQLSD
jgi:uncharacterized phage-associated protein